MTNRFLIATRGTYFFRIVLVLILVKIFFLLSRHKVDNISESVTEQIDLTFPIIKPTEGMWQHVGGISEFKFLVYSAYLDIRSTHRVTVIAVTRTVARRKPDAPKAQCKLWYNTTDGAAFSKLVPGTLQLIKEHWNLLYSPYYIFCPIEGSAVPDAVSILASADAEPENFLKVMVNYLGDAKWDAASVSSTVQNMAVCVKPLHYNYNKIMEILEFLELYQILGVNQFFLYNHTIGPQVDCILKKYENEGLVTILPWQLPIVSQVEIRTEGIFASLNDCLYRTMHKFSHSIFVDFDEFIVPRNSYDYAQLFESLGKHLDLQKISSFSFRNAFFYRQWPDDARLKSIDDPIADKLITLRKTTRKTELHKHRTRSKMIVRPELIRMVGNHFVWEYFDKRKFGDFNVNENDAFIHHYRECEFGGDGCVTSPSIVDTTAYRYKEALVKAVKYRYGKYVGECDLPALSDFVY